MTDLKITFTIAGFEQEFEMPAELWCQVVALLDHLALAGPHELDIAARTSKAIKWYLPNGPFASDETKKTAKSKWQISTPSPSRSCRRSSSR